MEKSAKPTGDGTTLGGRGDQRDPAGNVAWATLYTFSKVAARVTALEPPGRILNSLSVEKNFRWCDQFVKVIDTEATIREHRRRLIDIRTSADWLAGTCATYEATGLRKLYLDSLVDSDKESGFNHLPLYAASVSYHQALPCSRPANSNPVFGPKPGT